MTVGVLIFENYETLDVFGPVEIFGSIKDIYKISFYSLPGGLVKNQHGVCILTEQLNHIINGVDIFIIPGGYGTRKEIENLPFIDAVRQISEQSRYVLTVCTGSALLAKTGLLDGRKATSNKRAFDWVVSNGDKVDWIKHARWTVDEKYYTSSGVSAGMDMALGFLSDLHGKEFADDAARKIEYTWQEDKTVDNFS